MTLAVHHIAVASSDVEALSRTMVEGAGFLPVDDTGPHRWLAAPNGFVLLIRGAASGTEHRVCDPGITHYCVQSGDGEALWATLDRAGLAFNAHPVALGTGATYAYGGDRDRNVIEVEGIGDVAADVPPWIAHVALATHDIDRLGDFYATLIGRNSHDEGRYANPLFERLTGLADVDVRARWIMADNMIFETWQYLNPPSLAQNRRADDTPGYRHIGFVSDDPAAEVERLRSAGIALQPYAEHGLAGWMGCDPDGNRFVLVEAPPAPLAMTALSDRDRVTDRNRRLLV